MRETLAELSSRNNVEKITFACFGDEVYSAYQREFANAKRLEAERE
jgi:hypothetical protein